MSEVTAAAVKNLRDKTNLPMMECKKALVEAEGDLEKAVEILRAQFKNVAVKRGDKEAAEGRVIAYYDPDKKIGAILEVRCESAPVAKSEQFIELCNDLVKHIAEEKPDSVEALLEQSFGSGKISDRMNDAIGLLRENMKIARFHCATGTQGFYCHHDGSVGAHLEVKGEGDTQILRDVCMHITATSPMAGTRDEMPPETIEAEKKVAVMQTKEDPKMAGKPDEIIEKSVQGKLNKWLAQNVLLDQPFVKDETKKVGQILKDNGFEYLKFTRYRVGELS